MTSLFNVIIIDIIINRCIKTYILDQTIVKFSVVDGKQQFELSAIYMKKLKLCWSRMTLVRLRHLCFFWVCIVRLFRPFIVYKILTHSKNGKYLIVISLNLSQK